MIIRLNVFGFNRKKLYMNLEINRISSVCIGNYKNGNNLN